MSFNILGALAARGLDANADAVSGALFYVYTEGTTTQVTTYTDSTDTTANAHPVVADASGAWGGIYVAAGSYKVDIKTSGGASLPGYPVDNIKVGAPDSVGLTSAQTITGAKQFDDLTAPNFIDDMTAETSLAAGDTLAVHDASATAQRKVTYENFFGNVGGLTELVAGSVTLNDVVAAEDVSADAGRSIKISSILAAPNLLTEETDVDADADFILLYDTSESDARKVKPESLWKSFTSSAQTVTADSDTSVAHGLGVAIPAHQMSIRLKCTDAGGDQGWSQNDEFQMSANEWSGNTGHLLRSDATNCTLTVLTGGLIGIHKANRTSVALDVTKWEVYIEAVAL